MSVIVAMGTYEGVLVGWRTPGGAADGSSGGGSGGNGTATNGDGTPAGTQRPSHSPLELCCAFKAHEVAIRAVAIDAGCKFLITGAADETMRCGGGVVERACLSWWGTGRLSTCCVSLAVVVLLAVSGHRGAWHCCVVRVAVMMSRLVE
jgi:hypothetical protein